MVTFPDAVAAVREHLAATWRATPGTPCVLDEGYEDEEDFLVVWGTREYLVDGDLDYLLLSDTSILVSRETGTVRTESTTSILEKVDRMTPVRVAAAR